jgi:hypothetical protein
MSKFDVSFSDDAVTFVNTKTNKAEKLAMMDVMDNVTAIRAIRSEQNAAVSASHGAVSLLSIIMDNPRLDEYRGTCPIDSSVPNELKAAIRELETEFLKPLFIQPLLDKGAKPATAEKQWQDYAKGLKEGGSYAVAKGHITKLFAYTGKLPKHGIKLLTVAAIKKLLENLEKPEQEKLGIAGKLVALSLELRKENSEEGSALSAIAALKAMLVFYEAREAENAQAAQAAHEVTIVGDVAASENNIAAQSKVIIDKAISTMKRAHKPETAPF